MDETKPFDPVVAQTVAERIKEQRVSSALLPSVMATMQTNPDQEAEMNRMARDSGLPRMAVEADPREVANRIKLQRMNLPELTKQYPELAASMADPNFSSIAHDDLDGLRRLYTSVDLTRQPSQQSSLFQSMAANFTVQNSDMALIAHAFGHGDSQSVADYVASENRALEQIQRNAPAYVRQLERDKAAAGDSLTSYAGAYLKNLSASGRASLESLAGSSYTLAGTTVGAGAGAAVGSAVPAIGTAVGAIGGMAVGTATMSAIQNSASWLRQRLSERGVNLSDPAALKTALDDSALMSELKAEAIRKGVVQGTLDGLFAVIGGKIATAPISGAVGRGFAATAGRVAQRAGMAAGDVLVQSAGGALSEGVGQVAAVGKANPKDIVDEFLLGTLSEGADTAIGAAVRSPSFLQNRGAINAGQVVAQHQREQVAQVHAAAAGAKTLERDPDAVRAMVARQDPTGEVFIAPEAAKTYFQTLPPDRKDALTRAIPDLEQRIDNALSAGSDVVLPKADYVAHIAGIPESEFLQDHVKFYADDQTVAQILADDRFREINDALESQANRQDDIESFANRLKNQLLDTGRVRGSRMVDAMVAPWVSMLRAARGREYGEQVVEKVLQSTEVIGPDAQPRPRALNDRDVELDKLRNEAIRRDRLYEAGQKRFKTRQAEYERRVKEDFAGSSENARLAGVKPPRVGSGRKGAKYPVLNFLRKRGGVNPDGDLAAFLRENEITPKVMPALFSRKRGALGAADGIPISEFESYFDGKVSVPVERGEAYGYGNTKQNSYVPTDWLYEAIRDEIMGSPVVEQDVDPEQEALDKNLEYFDRMDIDIKSMTNDEIQAALDEREGESEAAGFVNDMVDKMRAIFGKTPETPATPKTEDSGKDVPAENIEVVQGQPIEVDDATLETVAELEQEQPALEQSVAEAEAKTDAGEVDDINVADPTETPATPETPITPENGKDAQATDNADNSITPDSSKTGGQQGGKIEDFGEKIEGARKDVWKDYKKAMSDALPDDLKDITLAKHFPEPAYDQLIANGVRVEVLAAIKAMRDYIPAKPRKDWKLQRWAKELTTFRDFANTLLQDDSGFDDFYRELVSAGKTDTVVESIKLYVSLGYPAFTKAAGYRIMQIEKALDPKDWSKGRKKLWAVLKDSSFIFEAEDSGSALEYLRAKLSIEPEPETATKSVKLDIYRMTSTGEVIIGKKVASGKFIDLKGGFKNAREASAYLKENEKALLVLLERKKDMPPERRSVNDPRKGTDYRKGENVTPEKFAAEFGFRGVQFGNYVEQGRRTEDLNNAYDALLDMADVLGIPSRAISLEGKLGLAFGARGKGGKNAAMAHFEPTNLVINLTKNKGAGSLGHEWFHGFDNHFGQKQDQDFLTNAPRQRMKAGPDKTLVPYGTIRPEVTEAFKGVMDAINKTDMLKRSRSADSTRSKDYWSTPIEMAARAFEAYLIYKAKEKGQSSDYLANVVDPAVYEAMGDADRYPYPLPDEMANTIAPAFDKLFSTLKTKKAEDGVTTILYQSATGDDKRGNIRFMLDGRRIIQLLQDSNLSTFLHETGHAFLDIFHELSNAPDAPQQVKDDMAQILKFLGAESYDKVTVDHHETFARTFEAYLASGEAPSAALQRAFRFFKAWISNIYAKLTGRYADVQKALDVKVTPEIKAVLDRMLATDEEIELVSKATGFTLDEGVLSILPKADRERYQRIHQQSLESAKERLLARATREGEREATQWWKEERAKLHDDVTRSVHSDPVYRAFNWLKTGTFLEGDELKAPSERLRLSRKEIEELVGPEIIKKLPSSLFAKKGESVIRPDALSEVAAFNVGNPLEGWRRGTGKELIMAMAQAEPMKERIERLTDETMVERHGNMLKDGSLGEKAQEVAENEFKAMTMEMEGRAAAELAKLRFPSAENMKVAAQKMIFEMKIQDAAAVDRFYRASVSSARLYGQAIRGKDWAKAVRYKRQQLLSHYLYREALEARDIRDKSLGVWRTKLGQKDEKLAKSNDMNFVYAARAILSKYGVLPFEQRYADYIEQVKQYDPEAAEDLITLVGENVVGAMPWRDMTYSQFIGLRDTVDNIIGVGKNSRFMEIDGQKRVRAEVRQELVDLIGKRVAAGEGANLSDGKSRRLTDGEKRMIKLYGARAQSRRVESWVKALDGEFGGIARKYLWNPINDARDNYYQARNDVFTLAKDVIDPHKERLLSGGKIDAPEIGYTFEDKGELISAVLNSANESNFERLLKGRNWSEEGWRKMMSRMEEDGTIVAEDWELMTGLAKIVKSMLPAAQKAHKAMYGYYFSEVKPWQMESKFGTFDGWYWPVVYDKDLSVTARTHAEGDILKQNNATMFPSTGKGFTNKRVSNAPFEPVQLGLNVLSSHIDKVLRFTHLEPSVKDVAKLVTNPQFKAAIEQYDPKSYENMIRPWLQRVASQSVELKTGHPFLLPDSWWRRIRYNTAMQTMMLNLLNAIQQVTGFSQSVYMLGPRRVGRALVTYMNGGRDMHKAMTETSTFMRHRSTVLADHIESQVTDVLINKGKLATVQDAAVKHGYIFQRIFQGFVDTVTWTAAMEKATEQGMSHDEAVRYADSVVRETQGSSDPTDISTVEAGAPFGRLFTMFYTYFNSQANTALTEIINMKRQYQGAALAGRMFYLYMMFVVVPAASAELIVRGIKGQLPEDDDDDGAVLDDWLSWFVGSQARYLTAMVPIVGQFGNALVGVLGDNEVYNDRISGSPVITVADQAVQAVSETKKAFEGKGDLSRWLQRNLTALGLFTGLPLGQLGKPLGYAADVAEGDAKPDGLTDVVSGVITGPPPANRR